MSLPRKTPLKRSPIQRVPKPRSRTRSRKSFKNASNSALLAIPKGPTRKDEKAAETIEARLARALCRETVKRRERGCSCRCGAQGDVAHVEIHEEPPRSRGGDPLNPADCLALAPECHRRRTGELGTGQSLLIVLLTSEKCNGPRRFINTSSGDSWVTFPAAITTLRVPEHLWEKIWLAHTGKP